MSIDQSFKAKGFYISGCKKLNKVNARGCTQIEELDICENPQLTELDLTGCGILKHAADYNVNLSKLVLKDCANLASISACGRKNASKLTTVDVTGCKKMEKLYLWRNQISQLDVSTCTSLWYLSLSHNAFDKKGLTKLFDSLPNRKGTGINKCFVENCPGSKEVTKDETEAILENKGWRIIIE